MKHFVSFLILSLFLLSCEDKKKSAVVSNIPEKSFPPNGSDLSSEDDLNYWISEVDAEAELSDEISYSFQFSNDTEEVYVLVFHINGLPTRIDEKFTNYVDKTYGTRSYYLQNDQLLFSREVKEEIVGNSIYQMRETISYYANSSVIKSSSRVAAYEEELGSEEFTPITPIAHPFSEALSILNNTDKYSLRFSDIIETSNATFLVLSTNTPTKMTTTVMLEYRDDFTNKILADKKKFKGRPVSISFEMVTSEGMTYQAYRGGEFTD